MSKAKYFLPLFITKIYLTAVLASLMQSAPFGFLITSAVVELAFLVFLMEVRPFESCFTNFRLMTTSLVLIAISVVFCVYLKLSMESNYVMIYE